MLIYITYLEKERAKYHTYLLKKEGMKAKKVQMRCEKSSRAWTDSQSKPYLVMNKQPIINEETDRKKTDFLAALSYVPSGQQQQQQEQQHHNINDSRTTELIAYLSCTKLAKFLNDIWESPMKYG